MKTNRKMDKLLRVFWAILICALLSESAAYAQTGAGSITSISGTLNVFNGSLWTENAETLVIRSNADLVINGTYNFAGKNILIEPGAKISGTGVFIISDPSTNTSWPDMPGGTTTVDGNNNSEYITVKISHMNPAGITLGDLDNAESTYTNPAGALAAALNIGGNLSLDVDGANVFLNANNLQFNTTGIISNPSAQRMVVTGNSTAGHMVKQQTGQSFLYPVGIAALDYTPATLTGTGTYNVSVVDYTASNTTAPIAQPAYGMDRTWHIYGGPATTMTLQHNAATNGASYVDVSAWITQYQGANIWSTGTPEQTSAGSHTSTGTQATTIPVLPTSAMSYYTKTNSSALPVRLASFNVVKEGAVASITWTTAMEVNFSGFDVERSADSKVWNTIRFVPSNTANGSSASTENYTFTDSKPLNGLNYYRLKMIDLDKTFAYSQLKSVRFEGDNLAYPNPVSTILKINDSVSGKRRASVRNLLSQQIIDQDLIDNSIDLSSLPSGIYILTITDADGTMKTHRIVKK